jgi:hypothetical protein
VQRQLRFTDESAGQLEALAANLAKRGLHKQVLKTLALLEINTRHPGLNTHEYRSLEGAKGERLWEAYAQNQTPGAYRVFSHYGPDEVSGKRRIPVVTIIAITPHPWCWQVARIRALTFASRPPDKAA